MTRKRDAESNTSMTDQQARVVATGDIGSVNDRTDPVYDRLVHRTFGLPMVQGKCPACRWSSLFLGSGGYVTCGNLDCPDPCAATDLLVRGTVTPLGVRDHG